MSSVNATLPYVAAIILIIMGIGIIAYAQFVEKKADMKKIFTIAGVLDILLGIGAFFVLSNWGNVLK